MAANSDFKKILIKDVELLWPKLDQPYRFNNAEKRSEPCEATTNGAAYSVGFKVPKAEASKLKAELKAHYDECKSRNSKLPKFEKVFGAKVMKDENGNATDFVQFTAKKTAMSNAGKVNKPPRVVGGDLSDLEDRAIWTGSKGSIRALAYPTTDPDNIGGISLLLDVVQVTEAVYGSDNLEDDFESVTPSIDDLNDETEAEAEKRPAMADADEF